MSLTAFRSTFRRRLLVPTLRLRRRPEQAARGALIGLAWAFTPTFGIRMPLVFLTWLLARRLFNWDFSLLIGLAWTWTTNILVLVPVYFAFHVTGRLLTGQWHDLSGLADFEAHVAALAGGDLSDQLGNAARLLVQEWGLTLWLGALPWSALMAGLGYAGTHYFLQRRARRRGRRMA